MKREPRLTTNILWLVLSTFLVAIFCFSPRFGCWQDLHKPGLSSTLECGRALVVLDQSRDPWRPIDNPDHRVLAWRLFFPLIWRGLHLPPALILAVAPAGCILVLWLTARLLLSSQVPWPQTWLATLLFAMLPWFFVSTGWLGYFDSWLVLGLLTVAFVPQWWAVVAACLVTPWVDERFLIALPVCLACRAIALDSVRSRPILSASAVYPLVRLAAMLHGDRSAGDYAGIYIAQLSHVPALRIADGLWSGYRLAWIVVAAGLFLAWRVKGWKLGALLAATTTATICVGLIVAQDTSRNMMMICPTFILGIGLWRREGWASFKIALPAIVLGNFLLPAANVLWQQKEPIRWLPTAVNATPLDTWHDCLDYEPPELLPRRRNWIGLRLVDAELFEQAEQEFTRAVEADHNNAESWFNLARARSVLGHEIQARETAREALRLAELHGANRLAEEIKEWLGATM